MIQDALESFAQQPELVGAMDEQINALPIPVLTQRLEAWLQRTAEDTSDLRVEFAGYVRDRLMLVRDQVRLLGRDALDDAASEEKKAETVEVPAQLVAELATPNGLV